jgi:hypothetical protein
MLAVDIQNLMTHEVGHWLGLGDLGDEDRHAQLTMFNGLEDGAGRVELRKNTLGYGDILGARSIYPCSCPIPDIYFP